METRAERHELQQIWLEKLREAGTKYQSIQSCAREIERERKMLPSPDGSFALQQALRRERYARTEYMRVLDAFTRLLLQGEIPKDKSA